MFSLYVICYNDLQGVYKINFKVLPHTFIIVKHISGILIWTIYHFVKVSDSGIQSRTCIRCPVTPNMVSVRWFLTLTTPVALLLIKKMYYKNKEVIQNVVNFSLFSIPFMNIGCMLCVLQGTARHVNLWQATNFLILYDTLLSQHNQ